MKPQSLTLYATAGLSFLLWAITILDLNAVATEIRSISVCPADSQKTLFAEEFAVLDKALTTSRSEEFYIFNRKIETPFRKYEPQPVTPAEPAAAAPTAAPRTELFLKGILLRATPYAILQDPSGKSFICKTGDTLFNQRVVRISKQNVTLADDQGSYSLTPR
jgi:hypothetical protein